MNRSIPHLAIALCCTVMAVSTVNAQEAPPDWPCIQGYVPEVTLGIYWPVAVPEDAATTWRKNAEVRALAERLGALDEYGTTEREAVAAFVESVPEAELTDTLSLLASGTVAVANQRRADFLRGIRRYTRQQTSIASQIEDGLNTLAQMDLDGVPGDDPDRVALDDTLHWHERVFDQREQAMVALCEQPVYVEQVLSDVLRDLTQYLP